MMGPVEVRKRLRKAGFGSVTIVESWGREPGWRSAFKPRFYVAARKGDGQ
jgi:hypothetical protein